MMVSTRPRRTREVTGPTPHSVAIFARPTNKRPPEQLILDRRRQEEARQQAEELTKYNKLSDLKNDWERWTDRKIQINTVKQRVKTLLQANQFSVEERRERLRNLLASEEEQYLSEMASKEETVLERQAKMRERAKALKEKREAERLAVVQDKLEQQWRDQCEELRSTLSKRQQDQVAAERMEQLRMKEEMELAKQEEEKLFADLWYADMMAKAERENADTQRAMAANRDMLEVLNKQMAALDVQKKEEIKLKEEEAILLKEQAELRKLEEQQALEEKRRRQQETRNIYDQSLRMKMAKHTKEMQEQLAFDLKVLEQLLEESRNEAMETAQRKRELREEDQRYRQYLAQLAAQEEAREREMEAFCDAEVEKMWQKKLAQWRLEKQARKKLLEDVLAARKQQVARRLAANEREQAEAQVEKDELVRKIEENRRLEKEQIEKVKVKNLNHQSDLISQMHYNQSLKDEDLKEEERMWVSERSAEEEYRRKLEDALASDHITKLHPMRVAMSGRRSASAGRRSTNPILG